MLSRMKLKVTDSYGNETFLEAEENESVYAMLLRHHIELDSPCHGNGSCHKCRVTADGVPALACALKAKDGMSIQIPKMQGVRIPKR